MTTHISFRLFCPYFASESIDVALEFPLTAEGTLDFIRDSTRLTEPDWLTDVVFTRPQLREDYGSAIVLPVWLAASTQVVMLIDAEEIGQGIHAFYHDGEISCADVRAQLDHPPDQMIQIYAYGEARPLLEAEAIQPLLGGVFRIVPYGAPVGWTTRIGPRLEDPGLWDPDTPHVGHLPGSHLAFQTEDEQNIRLVTRDATYTPLAEASETFGRSRDHIWVRAPTERPRGLYWRGKRVHSVIAVVEQAEYPHETYSVIFFDLRGIGHWIIWVAIDTDFIFPGDVIEELRIPYLPGHSLVIQGGRRGSRPGMLYVRDGDVLEASLQPTSDLTPTNSPTASSGGGPGGDSGQDGSSFEDPLPDSDDLPDQGPPLGPGPFGPPPPQPVNRPRSRTPPRRREAPLPRKLDLAEHLPSGGRPELFDLTSSTIELPHACFDPAAFYIAWPPEPLSFDFTMLEAPACVKQAISKMCHWSSLLRHRAPDGPLALHLYSDGSWSPATQLGGFGVVVVLESGPYQALFAAMGDQTHGNEQTPWPCQGAPALCNERNALACALLWALQSLSYLPAEEIVFHYDCNAVGKAASGEWAPDGALMQKLRDVQNWLEQAANARVSYEHVKAHAGHPLNELADTIAKKAANGYMRRFAPPPYAVRLLLDHDFSWIATSLARCLRDAMPFRGGSLLQWNPDHDFGCFELQPGQLVPTVEQYVGNATTAITSFDITAATLNVQGISGKHRYLESQFQQERCNLVLLQETKTASGVCASKAFLRLGTDSERHWGVAIWISREIGLFTTQGKPVLVTENDIRVASESPRLLVLEITVAGIRVVVFSGHCPHSGQRVEAQAYIQRLREILLSLKGAHLVIGGIDLNGRPPARFEDVTGDLQCGEADATGADAVAAFRDLRLWLPSTFSMCHCGESTTYKHSQGTEHRIDFVVQGGKAQIHQARSQVLHSFDVGGAHDDHWPAKAELRGTIPQAGTVTRLWRPRYDRAKILSPEGRRIVDRWMRTYRPPSWSTHPDEHCMHFNNYVRSLLDTFFSKEPSGPRAEYITPAIWRARDAKLALKARTRDRSRLWRRLVGVAFRQWGTDVDQGLGFLVHKQGLLYQIVSAAIGFVTAHIKRTIRQEKAKYLQGLAAKGGPHPADILRHLRSAGVGGAKSRPRHRQLPVLLKEDGTQVSTRAERDLLWLTHFGKQEQGQVETTSAFLARDHCRLVVDAELQWTPADLPSLAEIEAVIRLAPSKRAMGLDGIPSEILKAAPGPMASALQPLMTKSMLLLRQPLQWRGGLLYEAYKGAGQRSSPSSHRSLFVSSVVGKLYHKLTRRKIQGIVDSGLHEFHLGARRGQPVLYPAAYVLSFLRKARARGTSAAILFLDAEAAYYKICRELATGPIESDATAIAIFERFQIPPEDMHPADGGGARGRYDGGSRRAPHSEACGQGCPCQYMVRLPAW